jgi:hypothetical protein
VSLADLLTQTATVTRRVQGAEDEYGDPTLADDAALDYPCRLEQTTTVRASEELTDAQDRAVTYYSIYLPPDAVISYLDKVTVEGRDYEVDGQPAIERSPRGPHHIVAALRGIQGG